jgi:hypothetical protein
MALLKYLPLGLGLERDAVLAGHRNRPVPRTGSQLKRIPREWSTGRQQIVCSSLRASGEWVGTRPSSPAPVGLLRPSQGWEGSAG